MITVMFREEGQEGLPSFGTWMEGLDPTGPGLPVRDGEGANKGLVSFASPAPVAAEEEEVDEAS